LKRGRPKVSTAGSGKFFLFFVTGPENDMKELSKRLVEERLAACVNVIDKIKSVYWWEGRISEDAESLLIIKTESSKVQELIEFVRRNHPYKVPEVIGIEVSVGNPEYLNWILESLSSKI